MRRLTFLMTFFTVGSILLAACAPAVTPVPTAQPISLTDGLGRQIALSQPAQKIVSLAPSNTEILFALGAGGQMVGRDEFSDTPAEAKNLPSVGGSMGKYNLESIAALKPDLVLAANINTPEQVKGLEDLGVKVYYLSNPTDLDGMYANLKIVAQLTGRDAEAARLIQSLKDRVAAVTAKLASLTTKPKVFYELDGSEPAKPWTPGPGTFVSKLVAMAGGQNIGDALSSDYAQISLEELIVQNPTIILLGDAAYGMTAQQVAGRAGWNTIQAVKDNQILVFDDNLVSRPGPRLVDGLEILAKLLHPELFK